MATTNANRNNQYQSGFGNQTINGLTHHRYGQTMVMAEV